MNYAHTSLPPQHLWNQITEILNKGSGLYCVYVLGSVSQCVFVCIFLRLRIAFKWIVRAFSGYLSTDQLLLLWDRILGYDSLEIVAGRLIFSIVWTFANCYERETYNFTVTSLFQITYWMQPEFDVRDLMDK